MTPERWHEVERVFALVADAPVETRAQQLADACGDDAELVREVSELLAADADSDPLQVVDVAMRDLLGESQALARTAPQLHDGEQLAALGMAVGDVIDERYRIERLLGAGGMGVVVEATHVTLDERVAMKLLKPQSVAGPRARERFLREARAAAKVKSEHIVKMRDVGILDSGEPYMVMEMLDGSDLDGLMKAGLPLPTTEAVSLILQACEALAAAHRAGIVHRDIKPANLFLERAGHGGVVLKLLDFGVSKQPDVENETLTGTHDLVGSPAYMSPEQLRASRNVDTRADIWSLGVVLYELLSRQRPFQATSLAELAVIVLQDPPLPIACDPPLPPGLVAAVHRALDKDKKARFSDVAELAAALAPFAGANGSQQADRVARTLGKRGVLRAVPHLEASSSGAPPPLSDSEATSVLSGDASGRTWSRSWWLFALVGLVAAGAGLNWLSLGGETSAVTPGETRATAAGVADGSVRREPASSADSSAPIELDPKSASPGGSSPPSAANSSASPTPTSAPRPLSPTPAPPPRGSATSPAPSASVDPYRSRN